MQGELEGLWALIEAAEANQDGSTRDSSGILQRAHYGGVDLVRIGEYIDFLETQLGRITKQRLAKIGMIADLHIYSYDCLVYILI